MPLAVGETALCHYVRFSRDTKQVHSVITDLLLGAGFVYDKEVDEWWSHKAEVSDSQVAALQWDIQNIVSQRTSLVESPKGPRPNPSGWPDDVVPSYSAEDAAITKAMLLQDELLQEAKKAEKWFPSVARLVADSRADERLLWLVLRAANSQIEHAAKTSNLVDEGQADLVASLRHEVKHLKKQVEVLKLEAHGRSAAAQSKPASPRGVVIHCQNEEDYY